jgi:hypothetical protein
MSSYEDLKKLPQFVEVVRSYDFGARGIVNVLNGCFVTLETESSGLFKPDENTGRIEVTFNWDGGDYSSNKTTVINGEDLNKFMAAMELQAKVLTGK